MAATAQCAMLKREIEARLAARIPAALSPLAQQAPRLMPSGIVSVDELLGGGFPVGGIAELTGLRSSGRTSLAFSVLAGASGDSACAYIDVDDTVDPRSAAAAGVQLRNLLWVRVAQKQTPAAKTLLQQPVTTFFENRPATGHCDGHHPRTETKGLDIALQTMLAQKAEARLEKQEGTPGHPNRRLSLAQASEEQVRFEHFNARRADDSDPLRQADRKAAAEARQRAERPMLSQRPAAKTEKPWNRLEKAIRATDQILQSGGFRVVVLDLASVAHEQALRIPSATWFRFRRAAQESDAILLLLTQVACARSSAACVLDCSAGDAQMSGNLLTGLSRTAEVARQRVSSPYAKKAPGRAAGWESRPAWMRAVGA